MTRSVVLAMTMSLALAGVASARPNVPGPSPSANPPGSAMLAAPATALWVCERGRCSYRKAAGDWSDCFTAWSPTHGGWLPTRYCR